MFSQEGNTAHHPGAAFCNMRVNKSKCFLIKRIAAIYKNNPNQEKYKYQHYPKQDFFSGAAVYWP